MNKYISFSDLYTMEFDVTDIFAMRQKWYQGVVFRMDHPRKSTGILYLNGCVGEYTSTDGNTFTAPCKSLVCLPSQSEYSVLNARCQLDHTDAYLAEFNIVKDGQILTFSDTPVLISGVNSFLVADLIREVVEAYESTKQSPLLLKSTVYRLLAFLGKESMKAYNKKFRMIEAGIEILEADVLGRKSIEEIADCCHVSANCFRRLFREYSGKSPTEYRMDLRLDMAKNMLLGSDISIVNIADSLGFESTSYFSRLFKKKTGVSPSQFRDEGMRKG